MGARVLTLRVEGPRSVHAPLTYNLTPKNLY